MDWLETCTASGHAHLESLAPTTGKPGSDKVALVYHGLDFARFPPPTARSDYSRTLTLLSVGRLVPKKGYAVLLDALARLPNGVDWRLRHVGGGPLGDELKAQAAKLGIGQRIEWLGALPQEQVLKEYRRADLFVLASRVAEDGDRDGLPNVLMEAQSQRLAVVSTRISGVPELVIDGETGLLAPPDDAPALSAAISALLTDRDRRARLAEAGFQRVHAHFAAERSIGDLERRFRADLV
jgi:glycosyltransferase involved in cell wall biosynthesis